MCCFAVSNLPYPSYTDYNYTQLDGVCDERFYSHTEELSPSTCRFVCDSTLRSRRSQPCYGYTYYPILPEDSRLGKTVSTCRFLNQTCKPTRRKRTVFTYILNRPFAIVN